MLSDLVIVKREYLKSHRTQVVAFLAATIRGWQAQIEDPTKGAKLAVSKYGVDLGLDLTQQIASAKADIPFMKYDGTKAHRIFQMNTALITKKLYPSLQMAGITGLPMASSVIDMTVLYDAYKLLGKQP
jgi:ABC-type nitrate/sulfonate/bicarbonate transport system substrate-binding protein